MQDCIDLCKKLKQELDDTSYIPAEKLSGELSSALKETRNYQKRMLEEISKKIVILIEKG